MDRAKRIKISNIFILVFLAIFISEARSDTIHLKNGRSIEGLIKKEDDKAVDLDVGFGTIKFRREEIESIAHSSPDEASAIRKGWERQIKIEEESRLKRERELKEAMQRKEFEPKEVIFSHDKDSIVVEALINKKAKASLLLDTGATTVVLSDRVAKELGIRADIAKKDIVEVQVADGRRIEARYVVLDSISVQDVEAEDVGAVVLLGAEKDIEDGLLGMSFLSRFNFQIDTVNKKLILQKRK